MEASTKYVVRQPGKADREFDGSQEVVAHLYENPGYAEVLAGEELVATRGYPPDGILAGRRFLGEIDR